LARRGLEHPVGHRERGGLLVITDDPGYAVRAPEQLLHAIEERPGARLRVVEQADDATLERRNALGQRHGVLSDPCDRNQQFDRRHIADTPFRLSSSTKTGDRSLLTASRGRVQLLTAVGGSQIITPP